MGCLAPDVLSRHMALPPNTYKCPAHWAPMPEAQRPLPHREPWHQQHLLAPTLAWPLTYFPSVLGAPGLVYGDSCLASSQSATRLDSRTLRVGREGTTQWPAAMPPSALRSGGGDVHLPPVGAAEQKREDQLSQESCRNPFVSQWVLSVTHLTGLDVVMTTASC